MQPLSQRPSLGPIFVGLLFVLFPCVHILDIYARQRLPDLVELIGSLLFSLLGASAILGYAHRVVGYWPDDGEPPSG